MKRLSALEATNIFWASSQLIVVDVRTGLPEIPDIDKIKSVSLWSGSVLDFGRSDGSKPHTGKAVASIGAIDNHIILKVYDYNA
jgi:hypothetical protein